LGMTERPTSSHFVGNAIRFSTDSLASWIEQDELAILLSTIRDPIAFSKQPTHNVCWFSLKWKEGALRK
jgi:hypothetical protein